MNSDTQTNEVLEYFKTKIGLTMEDSPSKFARWLNGRLVRVQEGEIDMEFIIRKEMLNPINTLHGGVAAAIMDEMLGMCVFTLGLQYVYASVNLNVDFLEAGQVGNTIMAKTVIIRKGGRLVNGQCELFSGERMIARATSTLYKTAFPVSHVIKKYVEEDGER